MQRKQKTSESYQSGDRAEPEAPIGADSISFAEPERKETLYDGLIEAVISEKNLADAFRQVVANHGAPGSDGMTVEQVPEWFEKNRAVLIDKIRNGTYKPLPVRRKEIPKPNGGVRNLGIPSVFDRVLQQAVAQVLVPIYEPTFSDSSYGFRPGRSAQDAVLQAKTYFEEGYGTVVDLDLEKFFDTLNQDILMNILRERIADKSLLRLIKSFLRSGVVMPDGIVRQTREGSPQGGPLSPLLSNIYLDKFDKLLESRGLRFCRYADDCMIFVRSQRAGERVRESVTRFLEGKLRLRVNQEKTVVGRADTVKFLGFRFYRSRAVGITVHFSSLERFRKRIREITKRNRGRRLEHILGELKTYERGWLGYFAIGLANYRARDIDSWIHRRIRQYIFKQWKTPKNRVKNLKALAPAW